MEDTDNLFIVDASVILAALFRDEVYNAAADKVFENYRTERLKLLAPTLLPYEVINGLKSAFLRKRIDEVLLFELESEFHNLEIALMPPDTHDILETATNLNLSVYDSAYVSMMARHNKPLLTADKKLYAKLHKEKNAVQWIEDFK